MASSVPVHRHRRVHEAPFPGGLFGASYSPADLLHKLRVWYARRSMEMEYIQTMRPSFRAKTAYSTPPIVRLSTMRSVGSPHAAIGIARYGWFL